MSDFNASDFGNSTKRRLPICFCLDTSGSMQGDPINQLNMGLQNFVSSIKANDDTRSATDIAIITFGSSVEIVMPFGKIKEDGVPDNVHNDYMDFMLSLRRNNVSLAQMTEEVQRAMEEKENTENALRSEMTPEQLDVVEAHEPVGVVDHLGLAFADALTTGKFLYRDGILYGHVFQGRISENHPRRKFQALGLILSDILQDCEENRIARIASGRLVDADAGGLVVVIILALDELPVLGQHERIWLFIEIHTLFRHRNKSVLLDILVQQMKDKALPDDGAPETRRTVPAYTEKRIVMVIV